MERNEFYMCDLKANLNINMSRLCILILIIKQSNQSFTVLYLMIINEQIMNILWQNIDEGSISESKHVK